jgi:hypothetical protein
VDRLVPIGTAQLGLGGARAQARPEQLRGNFELRSKRVILGLDAGLASGPVLSFSNGIIM